MSLRIRIIPILLLKNQSLVKTVRFRKPDYIGDPVNTVRIFNELEVDELIFLDIGASVDDRSPDLEMLRDISAECFMPLGYGGGIRSLDDAKRVFDAGFEKVSVNSCSLNNPRLIEEIARHFGSQAIMVSIDVKSNVLGKPSVRMYNGRKRLKMNPVDWAQEAERLGAGEILLTSIDQEGTWDGFDLKLVSEISDSLSIPVIAHGGAGCLEHIIDVVKVSQASAVGLGSLIVYQKKGKGVLVNFPHHLFEKPFYE